MNWLRLGKIRFGEQTHEGKTEGKKDEEEEKEEEEEAELEFEKKQPSFVWLLTIDFLTKTFHDVFSKFHQRRLIRL